MKRHWLLTALGAILAGAGLHFLWQALPNPLFALISPVNESVWEHLKLLYWPFLAAAFVLARGADDARGRWCGLLVGLLARFGFGSILSMQNSAWGMQGFWDNMSGMGGMSAAFRFPIIFADILCILGGIVIIGGVALAIIWKKRGQQ